MELCGMEGRGLRTFRSRVSALAWFFRKSRDRWKAKYQTAQQMLRSFRADLRGVRRSREKWRRQAEALKAENRTLREQLGRKSSDRSVPPRPPAPSVVALLVKAR